MISDERLSFVATASAAGARRKSLGDPHPQLSPWIEAASIVVGRSGHTQNMACAPFTDLKTSYQTLHHRATARRLYNFLRAHPATSSCPALAPRQAASKCRAGEGTNENDQSVPARSPTGPFGKPILPLREEVGTTWSPGRNSATPSPTAATTPENPSQRPRRHPKETR